MNQAIPAVFPIEHGFLFGKRGDWPSKLPYIAGLQMIAPWGFFGKSATSFIYATVLLAGTHAALSVPQHAEVRSISKNRFRTLIPKTREAWNGAKHQFVTAIGNEWPAD